MESKTLKISGPITWDQLADLYNKHTGQNARVRPLQEVFDWAESKKTLFYVCPKEGTPHRRL